jgi:hypothetical protein
MKPTFQLGSDDSTYVISQTNILPIPMRAFDNASTIKMLLNFCGRENISVEALTRASMDIAKYVLLDFEAGDVLILA